MNADDVALAQLKEFGIDALQAGWLGCAMTLLGCFSGVAIGFVTDRFRGRMKATILILYAICTVAFLLFALVIFKVVQGNRAAIYATAIIGGTAVNAPMPLFFELAMETIFGSPISEGAGSALLSLLITIVQIVYLAVAFIPQLASSTAWMNWLMVGM